MFFYGIADAHGLESFQASQFKNELEGFVVDPKQMSLLFYRANSNRHRHAVVYQADLELEDAEEIQELINKGKYEDALLLLKDKAREIQLMKSPGAEKSWRMIPNPDLDPYHE